MVYLSRFDNNKNNNFMYNYNVDTSNTKWNIITFSDHIEVL